MNNVIFDCSNISKTYTDGSSSVDVLKDINFTINEGALVAIVGPSGSGKSTLLHLLGGLDKPTAGTVLMQGVNWQTLGEKKRCELRNKHLGFIYQFHHLLPEFSAMENIAMPMLLRNIPIVEAKERSMSILDKVGLANRATHKPSQLSGGERQRVAIARALVHEPRCILADEPTGNLDNTTAAKVFELMLELNKQFNTALVIVTHDNHLAARMDKTFTIHEGALL